MITLDLEMALRRAGFDPVTVTTRLKPAWTTDWLTESAHAKLKAMGIAPPSPSSGRAALFQRDEVRCPRCGSERTEELAQFGSTACKALWRCRVCAEPFEAFKCL